MNKPNILFVSAELTPVAKVGGLADVAAALPKALNRTGLADARLVLPFYDVIRETDPAVTVVLEDLVVPTPQKKEHVRVLLADIAGNNVYLLDHERFAHGGVYMQKEQKQDPFAETSRFVFFSQVITRLMMTLPDFMPDVLHCHDWHTGLVPALAKHSLGDNCPATVFTIHNLAMQGRWNREELLAALGLEVDAIETFSRTDTHGNLSIIEQGILNADIVNTVSKTYAKEILTEEYGAGLEKTLQERKSDLYGIVNGIDVEHFNPASDTALAAMYTADNVTTEKLKNKVALQKELGLTENPSIPLFGFVSRLTDQKGMELILKALPPLLEAGRTQLVILGTGDPTIEAATTALGKKYSSAAGIKIMFDAALAQRVYAGSDFFLMPSKFEPCGLGQQIALRYGAVPIARSTGGLVDTVPDYTENSTLGVGFRFDAFTSEALTEALERAIALFTEWPEVFHELQKRGMKQDLSWNRSAPEYATLYAKALTKRG
ncbi:MAG: glycogen/starch synthase [Patescibacteria group bacterium]|jgi:starch synthase